MNYFYSIRDEVTVSSVSRNEITAVPAAADNNACRYIADESYILVNISVWFKLIASKSYKLEWHNPNSM